jgi:hypothetical protein
VSALLHDGATEIDAYKDMLGQLWLYVDWRYVTKQLETEHKERWAQAVEAWSRALNPGDPDPIHVDRWWLVPDLRGEHPREAGGRPAYALRPGRQRE